jgi:hypothetical protein
MIKTRQILLGVFGLLLASFVEAQSTNITFIVKDQNTGFAVPGAAVQVTAPNGSTSTLTAASNGKLVFTAANGKYDFSIAANGYKPLATYFSSGEATTIEARINLEPATDNTQQLQLRVNANQTVLSGYVRDDAANTPLAGVQVSTGTASAITDSKGFFSLAVPVSTLANTPGATPDKATITFTKSGYAAHTHS